MSPIEQRELRDGPAGEPAFRQELKARVQQRLMETLDLVQAQRMPPAELRDGVPAPRGLPARASSAPR